jgi:5'-nucleotidase
MKILISNDDGVHAAGIKSLYGHLNKDHNVTMIAPMEEKSTTGHSLTLDKPLRIKELDKNIYGVDGFPADCVLMGIGHILKNDKPDIIISGINRGANLGQDLYYSGTVAAAREAAFHRFPSIAVSLHFQQVNTYHFYETAAMFIANFLKTEIVKKIPPYCLINVNVPNIAYQDLKGVKLTTIGFRFYSEEIHQRVDSRERDYFWISGHYKGFLDDPNSDNFAVEHGYISVTLHNLLNQVKIDIEPIKSIVEGMAL